jgi:ABC-2 type transport system permease protein
MTWIKAYPALLKAYWARALEYRGQIIIWILASILPLIMMLVWLTISKEGPVAGYDSVGFISYFLMVTLMRRLTGAWIIWDMDSDIRKGTLSPQLLKPIHPIHHLFTRVAASKPLQVILVGPPIAVAAILLGARYDLSLASLLFTLLGACGAMLLEFFAQAIIGATAFWITQANSLAEAWFLIRALFSGWIVPIDLFPPAITGALIFLPFRYALSFPVEIVLGRLSPDQIASGFAIQFAWVGLFYVVYRALWRRGLRRYGAVGA